MQKLQRIFAFVQFELMRLFYSKRGLLALIAFAIAWYFILRYLVGSAADFVSSEMFSEMAKQVFGMFGISELLNWPIPELAIYWLVTIFTFPVFTLYMASDQLCSDRARGTLRFITLRATRWEVIAGRFLGQLLSVTILVFVTLIAVLVMAFINSNLDFSFAASTSFTLFFTLIFILAPFVAFMSFINSFVRSARLSIVFVVLLAGFGNILVAYLEYQFGFGQDLTYLFPGMQISDMVNPSTSDFINYVIPTIQTAFYLMLAKLILNRSAL